MTVRLRPARRPPRRPAGSTALEILLTDPAAATLPLRLASLSLLAGQLTDHVDVFRRRPLWQQWVAGVSTTGWPEADVDTLLAAVLAADPPPEALTALAGADQALLVRRLLAATAGHRHRLAVRLRAATNPALTEAERDALTDAVVASNRTHVKRTFYLGSDWAALTPHQREVLLSLTPGWIQVTLGRVREPALVAAAARRLLTLPLDAPGSAAALLTLMHPASGLEPRLRARLDRRARRALALPDVHDPDRLRLARWAHAGTGDLAALDAAQLDAWLRLCVHYGGPQLPQALEHTLTRGADERAAAVALLCAQPGQAALLADGPGRALLVGLSSDELAHLAPPRVLDALRRPGADQAFREPVEAELLVRAQAGDGEAFEALPPATQAQLPDEVVAGLGWPHVRTARRHLLTPLILAAHEAGGRAGVGLLMDLEQNHAGPLADLADAVAAALT